MCSAPLVFAILEVLTILRRACEGEFIDEVFTHYVIQLQTMNPITVQPRL
jgi:hypothetical protein